MTRWMNWTFVVVWSCGFALSSIALGQSADDQQSIEQLVQNAAQMLVSLQEEDGAWPYEGVYRVRRQIPVGYRIGGSSIVCTSLLYVDGGDQEAIGQAITKSLDLILEELEDPLMAPSQEDRYDVRVWGHIYALDFFSRLELSGKHGKLVERTKPWVPKLIDALVEEEISGGGWNYAGQRRQACFVTAPALQALLLARMAGYDVPPELFERGKAALKASRNELGTFRYSGRARSGEEIPGSIARSAICETTLIMLGDGNIEHLKNAMAAFYEHWDELEKRRKKTGTHVPPYGIAPYYFYYGHRYLAQAIRMLDDAEQQEEFARYHQVLLKTKDEDDTWNDRVFERSKAYGTAMSILSLCPDSVLLPKFDEKQSQ